MATATGGCMCGAVRYECSAARCLWAIVIAVIASGQAAAAMRRRSGCREGR